MKALLAGTKKALKTEAVKVLYAPQYESLSIKQLLDFVAGYNAIVDYLPDAWDMPNIPRQVSTYHPAICSADPVCPPLPSGSSTCATPSSARTSPTS